VRTDPPPPSSEQELLERAWAWAGKTLGELAAELGAELPSSTTRGKGRAGEWIERVLGADAGSRPVPDFTGLGVELKTVPVDAGGKVLESTWVCSAQLEEIPDEHWLSSRVRHKLTRVLFVPVEGAREIEYAARRIGSAFLWTPDEDEDALLRADWEDFRDLISRGLIDAITARRGEVLQIRPKAANSSVRRTTTDEDGDPFETLPRGFYIRRPFIERVVHARLAV
jgi:DNA mismatch repair protein MutH